MILKSDLYKATKKILKEVRFGNLSSRLSLEQFPQDTEFVNDFNSMLEAVSDREKMVSEYQNFVEGQAAHLRALFNLLNEGAMTLSEDFKIISINDTQLKWLRKSKKRLVGMSVFELLKRYNIYDYPSNKKRTNYLNFFNKDRKNFLMTFEIKKIRRVFDISLKRFLDKDGKQNYFIVSKDITSDVELQKLKDVYMAMLAHDLKVPILAEAKVLDLLQKEAFGKVSEAQREAFNNMSANNKDMAHLVITLLDVHKLDDGSYNLNKTKSDVVKIIQDESEKLKYLAEEKNCNIIIDFSDAIVLDLDEKEFARVIKNILTNALFFAPENTDINVEITKKATKLLIAISDKGVGIEPDKISYVFDRYYTATKKYRKVGTGLGLYLSKKIINLHGGDITVKSVPKEKTTFTIILPM